VPRPDRLFRGSEEGGGDEQQQGEHPSHGEDVTSLASETLAGVN
jgi:hypothetical protein